MPQLGRPTILITSLLTLLALGLGLTTYTQPIFHPGPARDLEDLFHRALADRLPDLPVLSAGQTRLDLTPTTSTLPDRDAIPEDAPALGWARAAARADSAGLRGWLSPATLRWARTDHDTVYLALVRLTWHRGCPLVSRLNAVLSDVRPWGLQVVRVNASCPAPGNDWSRGHPG
jgi:hypothetical protein